MTEESSDMVVIIPQSYNYTLSLVPNEKIIVKETEVTTEEMTTKEQSTEQKFIPYDLQIELDGSTQEFPLDSDLQLHIWNLCKEYHISYGFIIAQIQTESNFDSTCKSEVSAKGLMQIRDKFFTNEMIEMNVTDIYNPYQNTEIGILHMSRLFQKYEGVGLVLMAYNCGESGARKLWKQGIYSTGYTRKILELSQIYQEHYGY